MTREIFDERALEALNLACEEVKRQNRTRIGTTEILLGAIRADFEAQDILAELGLDPLELFSLGDPLKVITGPEPIVENIVSHEALVLSQLQGYLEWEVVRDIVTTVQRRLDDGEPVDVVLDLSHVKASSSSAFGELIMLSDVLRAHEKRVTLYNIPDKVRIVLEMLGLETFFDIKPRPELATRLERIQRRHPGIDIDLSPAAYQALETATTLARARGRDTVQLLDLLDALARTPGCAQAFLAGRLQIQEPALAARVAELIEGRRAPVASTTADDLGAMVRSLRNQLFEARIEIRESRCRAEGLQSEVAMLHNRLQFWLILLIGSAVTFALFSLLRPV